MGNAKKFTFPRRALIVVLFALAMAYLEAGVVVYLQRALKIEPQTLFPLKDQGSLGSLGAIEIGREIATLVMLATVGWLAGSNALERLAWTAVAFGIWDIGYYAWLWVFIGWPSSLGTNDLLFLIPVPWVAPVWAPMVISLALIFFGLTVARRIGRADIFSIKRVHLVSMFAGGLVVIVSFTIHFRLILNGGTPSAFAWPIFVVGLGLAISGVAPLIRSR
ncbi:MAG TPA: hypothetical protein VIH79_00165 [Candidatus Nanopelagicaceae bacterium]